MLSPELGRERPEVLCYGHDRMLLRTRQWLLTGIGCPTQTVTNAPEYEALLRGKGPGVVVLCQTLTRDEVSHAVQFAAEHCPHTLTLLMYSGSSEKPLETGGTVFDIWSGPKSFRDAVLRLVKPFTWSGPGLGMML